MTVQAAAIGSQRAEESSRAALWIAPESREFLVNNGVHFLDDLDRAAPVVEFEKASLPGWRRRFAIDMQDGAGLSCRFYVKHFDSPPLSAQVKRILSGHPLRTFAGIEKYWIDRVGNAGIRVPQLVAFGDVRRTVWERTSALVIAEAPGQSLETWAKRGERVSRVWLQELARFVARFHAAGFVHRDLYLCHIFVDGAPDQRPQFCLIDLQRVMHAPLRRRRWIAREIAQLHYSTPSSVATVRDRLRWLKYYMGAAWCNKRKKRGLMRRILQKSASIAAHDARRRAKLRESKT